MRLDPPGVHGRFDELAKTTTGSGRRITLAELRDCISLAREEHGANPDPARLADLRARLGLPDADADA